MRCISVRSELAVRPEDFWPIQSMATVNAELGPWIRMSVPPAWCGRSLASWAETPQLPLFRSWVLLLGWLPLDRHTFGSFAFNPGEGFVERSSSWTNAAWQHERTLKPHGGGCELLDTVHFAPRLALLGPILQPIYAMVFRHRHKKLRQQHRFISTPNNRN